MNRVIRFIVLDILKNKFIILYTIFLSAFSWSIFSLESSNEKAILTLLNIVLLTVPLVSILFSSIYIYNSSEFIELLVSQPLQRSKIWTGLYMGLAYSLLLAYIIGVGLPILVFGATSTGIMLLINGLLITLIFISLAFLCSSLTRDKAKGIGIVILIWLYFALLFDGLVLFFIFQFSDYPIEKALIGISALSPIDMGRILTLLSSDTSSMLGYTGAVFKKYAGSHVGILIAYVVFVFWIVIPFLISLKIFKRKDL